MGWFGDIWKDTTKVVKWAAPAVLAPLTGGASLAAYGVYGAESANKANKASSQAQMDFQERMSNTEIQRRVQDLLAAGMNPMLAYNQGGASSGSGARYESNNTLAPVTSATNALIQRQQLENMTLQNKVLEAQVGNINADTAAKWGSANSAYGQYQVNLRQADKIWYETQNIMKEYEILQTDLYRNKLNNQQFEAMAPLMKAAQDLDNKLKAQGYKKGLAAEEFRENETYRKLEALLNLWRGK